MPLDRLPLLEQLRLVVHQTTEPLARRQVLERPIALLEELHGVLDRLGLFLERGTATGRAGLRLPKHLDDARLRLLDVLAFELRIGLVGRLDAQALEGCQREVDGGAAVRSTDHLTQRQPLLRATTARPSASPKVQTIKTPVPFSGSASSLGKIGTGAWKSGVTARLPKSGL